MRELSSKEASQVIGTSPGALRVSIHRAIKTLRASLAIGAAVNNRAVAG
jgi:DNA-directed RNA polymerase specialized sigma24 family protein